MIIMYATFSKKCDDLYSFSEAHFSILIEKPVNNKLM